MPKTLASLNLGPAGTPHSVKELRQSSFDLHETLGFPVIHKHKWNEQDFRNGLVRQCPLHDAIYDSDLPWDKVCFGTGYVGGYGDPTVVYVTLQDAAQNTVKISREGLLMMDQHPQLTAPWIPLMGDGDLIIIVDFKPGTWDVREDFERYELQEVTPSTIRGPEFRSSATTNRRMRVSQQAMIDKLPYGHRLYDVPIIADPVVPADVRTYFEMGVRVIGDPAPNTSSRSQDVRVAVFDPSVSTTRTVKIIGIGGGTHVHLG